MARIALSIPPYSQLLDKTIQQARLLHPARDFSQQFKKRNRCML